MIATQQKPNPIMITLALLTALLCLTYAQPVRAFNLKDLADIGSAYMTHLVMHEMGHEVVANEVGAEANSLNFFTKKNGQFYFGLSTYDYMPEKSLLPYAVGGDRMASYTFEWGLQSYRRNPTTFNKALMFFACADFLGYTVMGNYLHPDNDMYDPNIIRDETGCSKELLLGMVLTKTLVNAYRVYNEDFPIVPVIETTRSSAAFKLKYHF